MDWGRGVTALYEESVNETEVRFLWILFIFTWRKLNND